MTKSNTFAASGFVAGLVTAVGGAIEPLFISVGAGLLFSMALLVWIAITESKHRLPPGRWRYPVAVGCATFGYIFCLIVFSGTYGFSPMVLGIRASHELTDFGLDVWIGLMSAILVSSGVVTLIAYVLTGEWSASDMLRLGLVGLMAVSLTFVATRLLVRLPFDASSLLGIVFVVVLFSTGQALCSWVVGQRILG